MRPELSVEAVKDKEPLTHMQEVEKNLLLLNEALRGQLGFGDGTDEDNVAGKWITYVTTGDEDEITHNLGVVPVGFLVFNPPEYGFVCRSPFTAWTTDKIYLFCGEPSQTVLIFIVPPPIQV